MTPNALWEKAAAFHGHVCPGLTIGYRAALYAIDLLHLDFSADEDIVCIAENDACGCDAIQAILGCTLGKGNLLFHMTGKQAFSFYNRKTGHSIRLVLNVSTQGMSKDEAFEYFHTCRQEDMFEVKKTTIPQPEHARMFGSYVCEQCGEITGSNWIRIQNGQKLCLDCADRYDRFHA